MRTYALDSEGEERLAIELSRYQNWTLQNTCAKWAAGVVGRVTGENLEATGIPTVGTPAILAESIRKKEAGSATSTKEPKQPDRRKRKKSSLSPGLDREKVEGERKL